MYKKMFAAYAASTLLVFAAGDGWSDRIKKAAELDRLGRFTEAGSLYSAIVEDARKLPQSDTRRSEALNNGGSHAFFTGDFAAADALYSEALRAYKDAKEDNDARLASILANEALLFRTQARYEEAEKAARLAVVVNASAPHGWMNLAEVYRVEGKLDEAEAAARKGLELLPAGEQDGRVNILAAVLRQRGRYDEALALYGRTLNYQEQRHNAGAATTLSNIAEIYMHQGDLAKAEAASQSALDIWKEEGVAATPSMAATYNNLAQMRKLQGRFAEAEPLYRKALATWETCVGKNHPDYAKGLSNLADFFHARGNDRAAADLYRKAADIAAAKGGNHSPLAMDLTERRVEVLQSLGRTTDAQRISHSLR